MVITLARCQHEECGVEGDEVVHCYIPDDLSQPAEAFCVGHCFDHGYCWSCGFLWAGVEFFDFSPDKLCDPCRGELDEYVDEWDADDWEPYGAYDPAFWRSQPVNLIP